MVSNARKIAAMALMRVDDDGAYSNLILNDAIKSADLSKNDSAFVSALFYGVLERKLTLDYYIKKLSSVPFRKISPLTKQVLRCALYQIIYMDKIPESAAVNEAVNIIKRSKEARSSGYVNAVLRSALRKLPDLPDDLSVKYSCGESLCNLIETYFGKDGAEKFFSAALSYKPIYIRVNTTKITKNELKNHFNEQGITCGETENGVLYLENTGSIETNFLYKEGFFHVQDLSSQICADTLNAQKGHRVLDVCAAPGGKTFTICENMQDDGEIIACDLHEHRVKLVRNGAKRLSLSSIKTQVLDATQYIKDWANSFDRVLCDVPCSGSGIISRKPDIKYKDFNDVKELNTIQLQILKNGFSYLKPGAIMVYSTCSVLECENEQVVNEFIKSAKDAKISKMHTFLPHIDGTDGFFIAVIEKMR